MDERPQDAADPVPDPPPDPIPLEHLVLWDGD